MLRHLNVSIMGNIFRSLFYGIRHTIRSAVPQLDQGRQPYMLGKGLQ